MSPSPYAPPAADTNLPRSGFFMSVIIPKGVRRSRWLRVIGGRPRLVPQGPGELLLTDMRVGAPMGRVLAISFAIFIGFLALRIALESMGVGFQIGDTTVGPVTPGFVLVLVVVQQIMAKRMEFPITHDSISEGVFDPKRRRILLELGTLNSRVVVLQARPKTDWDAIVAALPTNVREGEVKGVSPWQRVLIVLVVVFAFVGAMIALATLMR